MGKKKPWRENLSLGGFEPIKVICSLIAKSHFNLFIAVTGTEFQTQRIWYCYMITPNLACTMMSMMKNMTVTHIHFIVDYWETIDTCAPNCKNDILPFLLTFLYESALFKRKICIGERIETIAYTFLGPPECFISDDEYSHYNTTA